MIVGPFSFPALPPAYRQLDVVCLYAQEDGKFFAGIERHLLSMHKRGLFRTWFACSIQECLGSEELLPSQISSNSLLLLMLSPAFVAAVPHALSTLTRLLDCQTQVPMLPFQMRTVRLEGTALAPLAQTMIYPPALNSRIRTREESYFALSVELRRVIEAQSLLRCTTEAYEPSDAQLSLPIHTLPAQRNPLFTGREELLLDLHCRLTASQSTPHRERLAALGGPTGYGKSQIALEYAYRFSPHYRAILWVDASSTTALIRSYEIIAAALRLPEREAPNQVELITAVRTWLTTHYGWLLILDGVEPHTLTQEYLPVQHRGSVLLTTTHYDLVEVAYYLPVYEFTDSEGTLFFLHQTGLLARDQPLSALEGHKTDLVAQAKELVAFLKGHPTALALAGAYIAEQELEINKYYRRYRQQHKKLLKEHFEEARYTPDPLEVVGCLNLAQIPSPALELLRICASLPAREVPRELFEHKHYQLSYGLYLLAHDTLALDEALEVLHSYALIQLQTDQTFSLSPAISSCVLAELSPQERHNWAEQALHAVNILFPTLFDHETHRLCIRILPFVQACLQNIEHLKLHSFEAFSLLSRGGYYLYARSQFMAAQRLYQNAFALLAYSENADFFQTLNYTCHNADYQQEIWDALQRALLIYEHYLGCEQDFSSTQFSLPWLL
ncbi:NB-ARC domain-containing protein [Tengunoibacter tsumagoiensis]|uniref:Uncharacterized protein n=1 Tax=Tengunoibacter tsumagoiensis TaxID=2014871 RepID=A0A401ZWX0_9CHLR|nr:NB-ARC domain-containing protein [Tengunoibacter tsumagoiensis]GCE11306.1 hypothetical protein KTT_11650 [Tengunoibacter tsumagoiensis]